MNLEYSASIDTKIGIYTVEMIETDSETGKSVVYPIQIEVLPTTKGNTPTEKKVNLWLENMMRKKPKKVVEQALTALELSVYDLTSTGNLTLEFSKPIILPPIEIGKSKNATNETIDHRLLGSQNEP